MYSHKLYKVLNGLYNFFCVWCSLFLWQEMWTMWSLCNCDTSWTHLFFSEFLIVNQSPLTFQIKSKFQIIFKSASYQGIPTAISSLTLLFVFLKKTYYIYGLKDSSHKQMIFYLILNCSLDWIIPTSIFQNIYIRYFFIYFVKVW